MRSAKFGAWVPATVPGQSVGAAYMRLRSVQDASLVKIETDASSGAEMHQMTAVNDVMRMRQLEQVELSAGRSESFVPDGRHVMLADLRCQLKVGENVRITPTLRFRDGRTARETVVVPVLRKAAHGAEQ